MSVYVQEGFLSPEECESVGSLFPPAAAGYINAQNGTKLAIGRRLSNVSFLTLDAHEKHLLSAKIMSAMLRANTVLKFDFKIVDLEPIQFTEYAENGQYDWHLDIGPGDAVLRKLSATVQLSPPESYDGGDLELWGTPRCERAQGALTVFPSYLLHRVSSVTRGIRQSLVAWAIGDVPFR